MQPGVIVAGKYRIEHVLGRGGMGTVVAATHLYLGTRVALKFLNEGVTRDDKVVQRFIREARSTASLASDHVCKVSDYGVEGDVPYIVMELLEGTDLAKVVRRGRLDMATAADYVMQSCAGLAEAHAAGIVHRDLKPGNLFVTLRGGVPVVKVLDFGVAKLVAPGTEADFSLTQTSSVMGSPGFMAPEQLRSSRQADARSDIWSLGVILYKLTSGRQPFKAESLPDLAIAIAMDPPPALPEVSPAFAAIVWRCLEKDPGLRFQNVGQLADALAPFAPGGSEARGMAGVLSAEAESVVQDSGDGPAHAFAPVSVGETSGTTLSSTAGAALGIAREKKPARMRAVVIGLSLAAVGGAGWWFATRDPGEAAAPVAAVVAAPPAATPKDVDREHLRAVIAAFPAWAAAHAGAPCPTSQDLGGDATIRITCDDQPGDQRIGAIAAGADGALDTADDVHSWELARADLVAVRGPRWQPPPRATAPPPVVVKPPVKPPGHRRATTPPIPPPVHLDSNGIPDQR